MPTPIRVSVLLPCHSLKFLDKAIESIAAQSMPSSDYEVILVADRIEISEAEELLRKSILNYRIFGSHKTGIVNALNLGLSQCKSSYVARMDEDDLMEQDRLILQSRFLDVNADYIAVGGQLRLVNEKSEIIGISRFSESIVSRRELLRRSPIAHPAAMFRREKVLEIGGYRENLPEDWDLWARLWMHGKIANLREYVLRYRIHENQLSRTAMYKHSTSRLFIGTSMYAREIGLRDCPNIVENTDDWLTETKRALIAESRDYQRFTLDVKKESDFMMQIKSGTRKQNIFNLALSIFSNPLSFFRYALNVTLNRYYFWKTL